MMERICRTMPYQWLPAAYLDHLETRTFPDRLASVQDGWDETRQIPILLYDHPDGYQLWNGNHRLTAARAIGAEAVKVVILPFNPPYTAAVNRETGGHGRTYGGKTIHLRLRRGCLLRRHDPGGGLPFLRAGQHNQRTNARRNGAGADGPRGSHKLLVDGHWRLVANGIRLPRLPKECFRCT